VDCTEVRLLALKEAEGTLANCQKGLLDEHISDCPECRAYVEQLRSIFLSSNKICPFENDPEFWNGFQTRVACECNRRETTRDRLSRYRVAYLPATFMDYSTSGLVRIALLVAVAVISIIVFSDDRITNRLNSDSTSMTIEKDSTGIPLYRSIEP
jgi:hypothetical protein